jgi:electron transport complex protein RnfC
MPQHNSRVYSIFSFMKVSTFRRGLRLPTRKHATEGTLVELVPPPKEVAIPLNQHFGAPNQSLVKVGNVVLRGQKIAEAITAGPMTVPVHASIAGIVKKIEPRLQSNNTEGPCVIIENDGNVQTMFLPPLDAMTCSRDEAFA